MVLLVPLAAANPADALVVLLSQVYTYGPLPPDGVDPFIDVGVEPEQMVCNPVAVFALITAVLVTL